MKLYFTIADKEKPHKVYFGTTSKSLEKRLEEIKKNDNLQVTDYFNKVGWKRAKGTLVGVENENYTSHEKVEHVKELYKQYKPTLQGNVQQSVFC